MTDESRPYQPHPAPVAMSQVERQDRLTRPRLLDLFCGAGGAAMGYHQAGFEVVGVDIDPQPNYPFTFIQADATVVLASMLRHGYYAEWRPPGTGFGTSAIWRLNDFQAIHASPPCQRWAQCGIAHKLDERHPDHLSTMRRDLPSTGLPYVIENIPTAPRPWHVILCGAMFDLPVIRHRVFQSSVPLGLTPLGRVNCPQKTFGRSVDHGPGFYPYARKAWRAAWREHVLPVVWPWMQDIEHEAGEAIPPAYTQWLGEQLLAHLKSGVAA